MKTENNANKPANAELINAVITLGNKAENVRLTGSLEERKAKFRELYYGTKNNSNSIDKPAL